MYYYYVYYYVLDANVITSELHTHIPRLHLLGLHQHADECSKSKGHHMASPTTEQGGRVPLNLARGTTMQTCRSFRFLIVVC